jgi:hypothetical protein
MPNTGLEFDSCEPCPAPYAVLGPPTLQAGPLARCHPGAPGSSWTGAALYQYHCSIGASFGASPWEKTLGPGETFNTTLTWNGGGAKDIYVIARPPGQPDRVLSTDYAGSISYGPIGANESHGVQLWGDGMLLYNKGVTGKGATLTASPEHVVAPATTTTLTWSSNVKDASLVRRIDGGAPQILDARESGQLDQTISPGHQYRYTVVNGHNATSPTLAEVTVVGVIPPSVPTPRRGHWNDLSRSNNGLDIRLFSENTAAITWYTFTPSGSPTWYQGWLYRGANAWTGELWRTHWNGTSSTFSVVGSARLELTSTDHGELVWQLDGNSGRDTVAWLFGDGGSPDLGGSWYDQAESGWGLNLSTQGNVHVAFLLVYTSGGEPTWVTGVSHDTSPYFVFPLNGVTGVNACPSCTGPVSISTWNAGSTAIYAPAPWPVPAAATIDATLAGGDTWRRYNLTLSLLTQ